MKALARSLHLLPLALLLQPALHAQYTTPNTGQSYTLGDLVDISGGVITATTDTSYLQTADFTLAANDTLLLNEDVSWAVDGEASIAIFGTFLAAPPVQATITAADEALHHQGMRFEDGSQVHLQRVAITYGGGIKCLTDGLTLEYCTLSHQLSNATTGAALELSSGIVTIDHVLFEGNEHAAISSAANGAAAPRITHCTFLHNGFANTNRPQINLGPSGADTTWILNNVVTGDPANTLVGGIGFSSLLGSEGHAVIDSNEVVGNRYGITATGNNITTLISNNILADNNTQGDPMLGGSGINLYGGSTNVSMVMGNQISGNLWGVTLQMSVTANFGDTAAATYNPGGNAFANNGNNGAIYALYNNTPNPVPAMNNCWDYVNPPADSAAAAAVIFDSADDNTLGTVTFMPFSSCGSTAGIGQAPAAALAVFPNPSSGRVTVRTDAPLLRYALYGASGRLVRSGPWPQGGAFVLDGLDAGLYLLRAEGAGKALTQRIVVR